MLLLVFLFDGRENRAFRYIVFLFKIDISPPSKKQPRFKHFQYQQCFLISATAAAAVGEEILRWHKNERVKNVMERKGGYFGFFGCSIKLLMRNYPLPSI